MKALLPIRVVSVLAILGALPPEARALSFSVAPGAVGGPGAACLLGPADVCTGLGAGANVTFMPAAALGLVAGDDVDALSFNYGGFPPPFPPFGPGFPLRYSVAPGAIGPGLPVVDPGAVYSSSGGGLGFLESSSALNGLALGDDLDGLDEKAVPVGGIFFSLAPGSPSLAAGGFTAGDIFVSLGAGAFGLFINAESLGLCAIRSLCPADDDLDALIVNTDAWAPVGLLPPAVQLGGGLLFSVAPGTIGPGLPLGTLPGDVLLSLGGGASALYAPGAALGLAPGDNLDALAIPEPGSLALFAGGLVGLAALRRRAAGAIAA